MRPGLTRMVTGNHPLAVDAPEGEGEYATEIAHRSCQVKFSHHQVGILIEAIDVQNIKPEFAHLLQRTITGLVSLQGIVIPIYNALAANKHQGIRLPIAFHESDEVAPVPGILLVGH